MQHDASDPGAAHCGQEALAAFGLPTRRAICSITAPTRWVWRWTTAFSKSRVTKGTGRCKAKIHLLRTMAV